MGTLKAVETYPWRWLMAKLLQADLTCWGCGSRCTVTPDMHNASLSWCECHGCGKVFDLQASV